MHLVGYFHSYKKHGLPWEVRCPQILDNIQHFVASIYLLPCSQLSTTSTYPEPNESSPNHLTILVYGTFYHPPIYTYLLLSEYIIIN